MRATGLQNESAELSLNPIILRHETSCQIWPPSNIDIRAKPIPPTFLAPTTALRISVSAMIIRDDNFKRSDAWLRPASFDPCTRMIQLVALVSLAVYASICHAQDTNTVAKAAGKLYFGSATDNPELTDTAYVDILSDTALFGQITPGNSLKWDATEPQRGTFSFDGGDAIVNLAQENGQLIRGHTTVWHSQLPSWVSDGNFDQETLTSIIQTHVSTVMGRYKGQIWDVVNEPFNEDGTFQSFVLYDTLGESYIDVALSAAREADPDVKLYINEFNIDGSGAKSTAMFNLVQGLQDRGVPIDGIGIQAHLIVGALPGDIQANFEQFASLGVEIAITELDIRMELPVTDEKLEQQRQDYQDCQGAALPWDENLEKKPAYDGIIDGFA
ncbi:hypothetical protein VNI00_013223 [Paramarasmius palmivorus]|uniref:Beta-xylanase n=1 Tax=Paramarasmius palmivorus TaxID=297713 RepID=A0AAW0C2H1_9AGAR